MKSRQEVTAEKIRGGFYSPEPLVRVCLNRVAALVDGRDLTLLEPSAGDGAFIRGLSHHDLGGRVRSLLLTELLAEEAAKCRMAATAGDWEARVLTMSFVRWAATAVEPFDIAVGNPPFVRFQFVDPADKEYADRLSQTMQVSFRGVSNLWIPIFLGAVAHLRVGGAFAFIVPAECFTGVSAGVVRAWLLRNTEHLQVDLFPPGSFPGVLQQVIILSGVRATARRANHARLSFVEHLVANENLGWSHTVPIGPASWTRYLLVPSHLGALDEARHLPAIRRLGELARLEVSTVTGANDYFSIDRTTMREFELEPWVLPLLPRIRLAPGVRFTDEDHRRLLDLGHKGLLLYFNGQDSVPTSVPSASRYIEIGVSNGIPRRYKCRVRSPWYRVPLVSPGPLLLSKRSHWYPRLVLNEARAATTDTIYQGRMVDGWAGHERDLVSVFHNSLTLVSSEIEGRSFGGGVLELVPSEIARLVIPMVPEFGRRLERLHRLAVETGDPMVLVEETDRSLASSGIGLSADLLSSLWAAHQELIQRRFARN